MITAVSLPRSTPEAQGIPPAAIRTFVDAAEREVRDPHSFMLLRHGQVVASGWWEPYAADVPHMLYSVSKSFASSAIGLLVAEGRLSLDSPVLDFFPDEAPARPGANLRAMRVRHLLTMSSGHAEDTLPHLGADWARAFLALPIQHEPGTHFVYNSGATYMLSAILQRITGMRLSEYLRPRLFEPLGIEHTDWETSPQGVDAGGWGLSITTAELARFGQLYLRRGAWQGRQLLPAAWVDEATARQIATQPGRNSEWARGYGYQFWRCRHGAYRADGAFGQFSVVMPKQDAVLALTAGTSDTQRLLDLAWAHLLPAMSRAPLPEDPAAQADLAERLAGLRLAPPSGARVSPIGPEVSGTTFAIDPNDDRVQAVAFDFGDDGCTIAIRNDRGMQRIACGHDRWVRGTAAIEGAEPWPVAASGAWSDDRTYEARLCWYQTPYSRTLTCRFDDDRLEIRQEMNVSFGSVERRRLEGRPT